MRESKRIFFVRYNHKDKLWEFTYLSPWNRVSNKKPSKTRTKQTAILYVKNRAKQYAKFINGFVVIDIYLKTGKLQNTIVIGPRD